PIARLYSMIYANPWNQTLGCKMFGMVKEKNYSISGSLSASIQSKQDLIKRKISWIGSNSIYSINLTPNTDATFGVYIKNNDDDPNYFYTVDHYFFNRTSMLSLKTELENNRLSLSATGKMNNVFNISGLSVRGQVDASTLQVYGGINYQPKNC